MKRFFQLALVLVFGSFIFSACKNEGKTPVSQAYYFDAQDTTEVLSLCDEYMTHVKNQDYAGAFGMLSKSNGTGGSIDYAEHELDALLSEYKHFPMLDYERVDYCFAGTDSVAVTYKIKFMEKPADQPNFPDSYRVTFSPFRVNGIWHLDVLNSHVID